MANVEKKQNVEGFQQLIKGKSLVFFNYQGFSVKDFDELRGVLRADGGTVRVMKNTLASCALNLENISVQESWLKGMVATAISDGESFSSSAKKLFEIEKEEKVVILGGLYAGELIEAADVRLYGSMPSQNELYQLLVGSLQTPLMQLVSVLEEIAKQQESTSEEAGSKSSDADGARASKTAALPETKTETKASQEAGSKSSDASTSSKTAALPETKTETEASQGAGSGSGAKGSDADGARASKTAALPETKTETES